METTVIPQLTDEMVTRIKSIVSYHYHFEPTDHDIDWIDSLLRNHYIVLHDQVIIRYLVDHEIGKSWMKHRDRMGSLAFETILHKKAIFTFLTLDIPGAGGCICSRTNTTTELAARFLWHNPARF
jgi:hypothetical protein